MIATVIWVAWFPTSYTVGLDPDTGMEDGRRGIMPPTQSLPYWRGRDVRKPGSNEPKNRRLPFFSVYRKGLLVELVLIY